MKLESLARYSGLLVAVAYIFQASAANQPYDPLASALLIQQQVAEIRGLAFKKAVPMERQTPEELGRRLDKDSKDAAPGSSEKNFDRIVRRLGLYRGPEIKDFGAMMRSVMTTQAAAYYNSGTGRIYILAEGRGDIDQGLVYSHELYHALQDQHFNLRKYQSGKLKLDSDQQAARVAVVEGEATFIHTTWVLSQLAKGEPVRALIGPAIRLQADAESQQMRQSLTGEPQAGTENIPYFIFEILMGNYLRGAAFIEAVQQQGWSEVEKLYKEYPPQSTEQILHPEKWLAHENPAAFRWSGFRGARALKGWQLIEDDVLGEVQLRIIFRVQGMGSEAEAAASGWNGDRYAVFRRKGSEDTLLLLRTAWDSETEAAQFAGTYRRMLALKYPNAEPSRVEQQGADVFIVEGGSESDHDALLGIVRKAKNTIGKKAGDRIQVLRR